MSYRVLVDDLAILILFGEDIDLWLKAGRAIAQLWDPCCLTSGREGAGHICPVAIFERIDDICGELSLVG